MAWATFDSGQTIGETGSESGEIVQDEEHDLGSRITLEARCRAAPYAITCGIYGWMAHTRFFPDRETAKLAMAEMKSALETILAQIPSADDPDVDRKCGHVTEAIGEFVKRFP